MMTLQALVVSQDLCWRQKKRRAQRAILAIAQQHRRKSDSIRTKTLAEPPIDTNWRIGLELGGQDQEMPAARFESLNLGKHPLRQLGVAGGERNHDRVRIFAN